MLQSFFEPVWRKILLILFLIILFVVLINYLQLAQKSVLARDKNKAQVAEAKKITRELSRLVVLPKNQDPKIATIINAEAARKQNPQFYARASDGDIVVIYGETAYIYNPRLKRIVNMGPVYNN